MTSLQGYYPNARLKRSAGRVGAVTCTALWLAYSPWITSNAAAQATTTPAISVVALCDNVSRATSVDLNLAQGNATVRTLCVTDHSGRSQKAERIQPLWFTTVSAALVSVYDSQISAEFDLEVSRKARGQEVRLNRRNGEPCAMITVSAIRSRPVPERFISTSGDWQSAIDFQVDKDCQVLAVRLGNRLAIVPTRRPAGFGLYGVRFQVS